MLRPHRFRLPGEFEPHRATWLLWPNRPDNWRCQAYHAQHDVIALASIIAHYEQVRLGAPPESVAEVRRRLPPPVEVIETQYDDIWIRDTGPSVLVEEGGESAAIDWIFNSWGGLFSSSSRDDQVAQAVAEHEHLPHCRATMVVEGGAILTDGKGTLVTTEESILAANRNPALSKLAAEGIFRDLMNITNVIWLPAGLANDEAGGHIDNVCAFASSDILLVAEIPDSAHPSHGPLSEAWRVLEQARNAAGSRFQLVPVPLPVVPGITADEAAGFAPADGTIMRHESTPLAPSYTNLYIINGAVIVPTFNVATDDAVLRVIEQCFPRRDVIPFSSREFLLGGGAIHCLTKEIPEIL